MATRRAVDGPSGRAPDCDRGGIISPIPLEDRPKLQEVAVTIRLGSLMGACLTILVSACGSSAEPSGSVPATDANPITTVGATTSLPADTGVDTTSVPVTEPDPPAETTTPTVPPTTVPPETTVPVAPSSDGAEGSGCSPGTTDLPDGTWFGFVEAAGADVLNFDLACWYIGDAAAAAAAADGEESPPPNDYYVRNQNQTLRTLTVHEGVEVIWYPEPGDPTSETSISYAGWVTADRVFTPGVWIEIAGGDVVSIREQWVP
jgi:hypothetical protein